MPWASVRLWHDRIIVALVFLAFSGMLGAALIGTLTRYLTFLPIVVWGEEVTRFAGIWSVFLASGHCVRVGAHLGVDLAVVKLAPSSRRLISIVTYSLILGFVAVLLNYGIQLSLDNLGQFSPALEWRMGLVYLCMPIGAALMGFEALLILVRLLRGDAGAAPAGTSAAG
jgi:TRAP-type transport system small permease protein